MKYYGAFSGSLSDDDSQSIIDQADVEAVVHSNNLIEKRSCRTAIVFGFVFFAAVLIGAGLLTSSNVKNVKKDTSSETVGITVRSATSERLVYSLLDDGQIEVLFAEFISEYGKSYMHNTDEYAKRLVIFKTNLASADERNAKEALVQGTAIHGITKFSDLSVDEFVSTFLMSTDIESESEISLRRLSYKNHKQPNTNGSIAGATSNEVLFVDWSETLTTAVKDSGACASSWVIAAVEQLESDAIRAGIISASNPLSIQEVLSCTPGQGGCTSGSIDDAFDYMMKPNGLFTDDQYPYTATTGDVQNCTVLDVDYTLSLGGVFSLVEDDNDSTEESMLSHLKYEGTFSACIDATTWSTYVSGEISNCAGNQINHCIQVVGIYYSSDENEGYYKVRNSWGTDWGDQGFATLKYGQNICGITYNPAYTYPINNHASYVAELTNEDAETTDEVNKDIQITNIEGSDEPRLAIEESKGEPAGITISKNIFGLKI